MLSKIKLWFFNHKNFLRMSRFLILTVSLLLVTWIFDHQYIEIKSYIPKQLLLSVEVSIDFLSNISGIFLTISTFCFTIIDTVLNKYSSSISPRMLQSFIDRTGVLGLYGIFVSGFFLFSNQYPIIARYCSIPTCCRWKSRNCLFHNCDAKFYSFLKTGSW